MKYHLFLVIIVILSALSCNRDSNELAPSKFEDQEKDSLVLRLNGVITLQVTFIRKSDVWEKSTDMVIQNFSGQNITELGFYVEVCDGAINYDNCDRITSYSLQKEDTLKTSKAKTIRLVDDYFFGTGKNVSLYITALNATPSVPIASNLYQSTQVSFISASKKEKFSGVAKSFVQLDGTTNFLIKSERQDLVYSNISGTIARDSSFIGKMEFKKNTDDIQFRLIGRATTSSKVLLILPTKAATDYDISSIELDLH